MLDIFTSDSLLPAKGTHGLFQKRAPFLRIGALFNSRVYCEATYLNKNVIGEEIVIDFA